MNNPPNIPLGFDGANIPSLISKPVSQPTYTPSPAEQEANAYQTKVEADCQKQDADMERLVTLANIFQAALYHPTNEDTGAVSEHPYWDHIDLGAIKQRYHKFLLNLPTS